MTEIKVILVDSETNRKVHVFLYDYFREFCIEAAVSFNDFCNKQIKLLFDQFKVERVRYISEAELRLGHY
jgi:hypothetical protein